MYTIAYNPSCFKIITILVLAAIYGSAVHYFISYFFIHSSFVTVLVILFSLMLLIKAVGLFVMFPGSYRYVAAMVQKSQNDHLLNSIRRDMQIIQRISIKIIKSSFSTLKQRPFQLHSANVLICINTQLSVLRKNPSFDRRKIQLIDSYASLISNLNKEFKLSEQQSTENENSQKFISLSKLMKNPYIVLSLRSQNTLGWLKNKANVCLMLSRKIWKLCENISKIGEHPLKIQNIQGTYKTQQNQIINIDKFEIANWHMFTDKLFTMTSYYGYWDDIFIYSRVMVPVTNADFIQCVIIHGQKPKINQQSKSEEGIQKQFPKIAALICNPNGAFLQAFGLSSNYINFYIKWGFQVVLWNYRGYAQSTGIPSVSKCISDVEKVYHFINKKYKIKIEIVHGYSIGGISAINLVHKINSQGKQPIKLLVADRTFSSLDRVASGFFRKKNKISRLLRKISQPIVKTLFMSQCVDNSSKFIQCKCFKVCIFDKRDQIINSSASLKYGLLANALQFKRQLSQQPSNQSQRLVQLNCKQTSLFEEAQLFSNSIYHLYQANKIIYEKVVKILYDTDGGGEDIYLKIASTQLNILQKSKQQMKYSYIVYFTSLVIFGPRYCMPSFISEKQQEKWVQARLQQRINMIKQNLDPNKEQNNQINIKNIIKCLQYAKNQLKNPQMLKNRSIFGRIIVTDVGHNSQIKRQFIFLENAVRNSIYSQNENIRPSKNNLQDSIYYQI